MSDLDPRGLEAAARASHPQFRYWLPKDEAEVSSQEVAEAAVTAYFAITQPVITTVEELEGLEVGTIILDRFEDEAYTRIVGPRWVSWAEQDGLRHTEVALPARVLWRPQS